MTGTTAPAAFNGFSKETVAFFKSLKKNNNREWFERNRPIYEAHVLGPAKAFVTAMGAKLRPIVPRINAVPQINKSIFRLNRDTRFSMDPIPYKTNLGILFWEGATKMEGPGFYFGLEPPELWIGAGTWMFSDRQLPRFRRAAVDPKLGKELTKILSAIGALQGVEIGGTHYKRVPAGFDAGHPNAALLLHNGLYAGIDAGIPDEFYSARLVDFCLERFIPLIPLHRWLVKALA